MTPGRNKARVPRSPDDPLIRRKDGRIDGRSSRRTGRNIALKLWVTDEFRALAYELAAKEGRAMGAIFEDALRAYARRKKTAKGRAHTPG
jgi:hypothetical protein